MAVSRLSDAVLTLAAAATPLLGGCALALLLLMAAAILVAVAREGRHGRRRPAGGPAGAGAVVVVVVVVVVVLLPSVDWGKFYGQSSVDRCTQTPTRHDNGHRSFSPKARERGWTTLLQSHPSAI
jgi:O-antigen ligase